MKDWMVLRTLNGEKREAEIKSSVLNLIDSWYRGEDVPADDDPVISCMLNTTSLHPQTFGELMAFLTGDRVNFRERSADK